MQVKDCIAGNYLNAWIYIYTVTQKYKNPYGNTV